MPPKVGNQGQESSHHRLCGSGEPPKWMTKRSEALGLAMNALTQALASLNKCLLNNQSLKPGQFYRRHKSKHSTRRRPIGLAST